MSAEHRARIRDRRKAGWFRMDDELIEVYGPKIGVHGIAVYAAISKHADKEESSHPGLRRLCEKLRIGRKKLLDTLAELEEVGLIEIEPGDRKNVSVYTLLDVPKKSGSNESYVVPTRTRGGSNENQGVVLDETRGGSEQHQGGGSNQNRNQTHLEPNPVEPEEESRGGNLSAELATLPDDATARCLLLLKDVKGFPREQAENALYLMELRDEFPKIDPVAVCRSYQVWMRDNPNKTKNYRSRLRKFFENQEQDRLAGRGANGSQAKTTQGGSRDGADKQRTAAGDGDDLNWLFGKPL